jgi:hypothetical protein
MRQRHQAISNGPKAISARNGHGAQQGKDLHTIAVILVVRFLPSCVSRGQCHWFSMSHRCRTIPSNVFELVRRVVM